ncbi:MAG: transcriptional repressor [Dictyoglomus sp. NZ13-RE01]|nr:MAG: transcriptional repressor [Dictyoglomus sp. NZ13-RE01]
MKELRESLKNFGFRLSKQRMLVLQFFEEHKTGHYSINDIYKYLSEKYSNISYTSVYRTCKLLEKLGLIRAISFEERHIHYESNLSLHLHYQCLICGKVFEDEKEWIKELEEKLYREDFEIKSYRIQVYGICSECRKRGESNGKNIVSNE